MKLILLLAFALPLTAAAQTKEDYEQTMQRFQKFYNAGQGDSINAMFGHEWNDMKSLKPLWTNERTANHLKEYGQLQSFRFIGIDNTDPNKVYVFETVFSIKGKKTTSLTLDSDYELSTFRFITSSAEIDKLLKNAGQ